ncbi:MAG TPA: polysaccharide biosynthesis tyrosine autokinase, partial [Geminicoccaceae bacterium]|nr:polysaccharide biosynthesis tyrosine autokinase [Geminicoccaceae bacterium]
MKQQSSRVRRLAPSQLPEQLTNTLAGVPEVHAQSNLAWPSARAEERVDLRAILASLWRGRRLILTTIVTGCLLGFVVIRTLTPLYTASTTIMLETRPIRVTEEPVFPGLLLDDAIIEGEIEVLQSRELAKQVVVSMNLAQNAEFNPGLLDEANGFSWEDLLGYWPSDLAAYGRNLFDPMEGEESPLTDEQAAQRLHNRIIDGFLERVQARQVGQSPVIRISFTSENPQTAWRVANALAETYREQQLALKYDATRQASASLNENIVRLRREVEAKEREVEEFRASSGLFEGRDVPLITQQIIELQSQLVLANAARQEAEARLRQAEPLLVKGGVGSAPEVLASELIQDLRVQQAELRRALAEARGEFGPNHPRILNAQAQLGDIEGNIQTEIAKIVDGLRNLVEAGARREAGVQEALDRLRGQASELNRRQVELRALEREAEAKRTLLESQLARVQETEAQAGFQQADARIISRSQIPESPSFPNKKLFLVFAFCASAVAGVSLAYLLQAFDERFQTADQVRDELGVPLLELLPKVRRRSLRRMSPVDVVVEAPSSTFSEALRNLQVSLLGRRTPPKTVLFTSSLPEEGKTSLTVAFGRLLAMADHAVVVVDCDLRKSSVHSVLQGRNAPGLVDHLLDGTALDQIIQIDKATGMHYIASGPPVGNAPDPFASQAMYDLLAELVRRYDVVLVDSAPVLAVAETRCLHQLVDQTVVVVRWCATSRSTARAAVRRLQEPGYTIAAVLNNVDLKSYRQYDYSYSYDA